MNISITKTTHPAVKPDSSCLEFGKFFTDHMFIMDYDRSSGWHDARIVPFGKIELHPACTALHYGSEIFEGLKAYRKADGSVQLFRPIENVRRMNRSAERLCLPQEPQLPVKQKRSDGKISKAPGLPGAFLYLGACDRHVLSYG